MGTRQRQSKRSAVPPLCSSAGSEKMERGSSGAEKPAKDSTATPSGHDFVPREQSPQQAAKDAPSATSKAHRLASQVLLTKLIRDIGHETDPDIREASKGRKKALKAVAAALQDAKSSPEERQAVLVKALVAQVQETSRLERLVVPVQQKYESALRLQSSLEQDGAKKAAMNQKLQDLCRSLQGSNNLLRQQLEKRQALEDAEKAQSDTLQRALKSITDRLDEEKDKLAHLHAAAEQNAQLKEQVIIMGKQIEVQQRLSEQQEVQLEAVQELLSKQQQEEATRQTMTSQLVSDLRTQNEELQGQVVRQEELLGKQQKQFEECNAAIKEATQGFESYQEMLKERQSEVESLRAELRSHRKAQQLLQEQCGPDAAVEFRKMKARKMALESLCRALQDELRKLKHSAAEPEPVGPATPGGEGSENIEADIVEEEDSNVSAALPAAAFAYPQGPDSEPGDGTAELQENPQIA